MMEGVVLTTASWLPHLQSVRDTHTRGLCAGPRERLGGVGQRVHAGRRGAVAQGL